MATAERSKKSADSSASPGSVFVRSRQKRSGKCVIRRVSVSSKVFWKPRKCKMLPHASWRATFGNCVCLIREEMKREDDQQLWTLLGQARQVELSPFFARNVVRKIREHRQRFKWLRGWLGPRKLVPAAGLAVAIVPAMLALHQPAPRRSSDSAADVIAR